MKKDALLSYHQPGLTKEIHSKRQSFPKIDDNSQSTSEDFIDNYYLLNDGKTKIETTPPKKTSLIDPVSIDIDLELDKKFRDLKYNPSTNVSTLLFNDL